MCSSISVSATKAMIVRISLYKGLYKGSSVCVRAAEYLDKGLPFIQESWATIRTQVRLLFSNSYCSYARLAQPGPSRTRLCGPCIAAIAGV